MPLADGGRISGSTNTTLNLAGITTKDAGNYLLVASNVVGVTTSSVAVLTPVILPPTFILQPASQSVLAGSNVTFTANVAGTPPYIYQWSFNGTPLTDDGVHINGSATTSLSLSNLTTADAGNYTLTVTNVSGATNSAAALLTVLTPPLFITQPVGRSVPPGLPTTFNALASGIPTPTYQWQLNGTNIPGATGVSYVSYIVAAAGTGDLGFYHLIASNSVGVAVSSDAQLTFGPVAAWGRNISGECWPPPGLSNVIAVAGSSYSSYAARTDGSLVYWGSGVTTNVPAGVSNVVAIATSQISGNYVLRADGTVFGWNGYAAPALSNIVAIAAGNNFALALRAEGTIVGWGDAPYSIVPAGLNHVTAIACGITHSLALRNDGTVAAWGIGSVTNIPAGLANVAAIAAGGAYSLALKTDGTVVAWGAGSGTNLPPGLTNITAIAAENDVSSLSVAIRANGNVVTWGDNAFGQTYPPAALSNLVSVAVSAAWYHGLALINDGSPQILHPPVGLTAYVGRDVTLQASAAGARR